MSRHINNMSVSTETIIYLFSKQVKSTDTGGKAKQFVFT